MPNIWYLNPTETFNSSGNGTSWIQARQRFDDATTSNYVGIQSGDTIRVAKSPDPYSIGNATWTDMSRRVTFASARTKNVDLCDSGWQAVSGECTLTHTTTRRQGSNAVQITKATAFNPSTKIAYKALGSSQDFSEYQCLNLWIRNSVALTNNMWIICLCSDTAGNDIVDSFPLCNGETTTGEGSKNPAIPSTNRFVPLVIKKSGGGNLDRAIQSVAIYSGSSPMGAGNIIIDNIFASKTGDLNLQSLISPQGLAQGNTEQWYAIRYINETEIEIDGWDINGAPGVGTTYGFVSLTSTNYSNPVETYARETIKPSGNILVAATSSTAIHTLPNYTTIPGQYMLIEGGYDTTDIQNGETFLDGLNGWGYNINVSGSCFKFNHINCVRYYYGYRVELSSYGIVEMHNVRIGHCTDRGIGNANIKFAKDKSQYLYGNLYGYRGSVSAEGTIYCINNYYSIYNDNFYTTINKIVLKKNGYNFYSGSSSIQINDAVISYTNFATFDLQRSVFIQKFNLSNETVPMLLATSGTKAFPYAYLATSSYNGVSACMWGYGWTGELQSAVADSGKAWKFTLTTTNFNADLPMRIPFGKLLLKADKNYTLSLKLRHSSTNVKAKFVVKANAAVGLMSDVESELLDTDTIDTWVTKTLTLSGSDRLTSDGVVEIELWFWATSSSTAYLYADSLGVA